MAMLSLQQGWHERAASHFRELLVGDNELSDEVLDRATELASDQRDDRMLLSILERRVASATSPREAARWETQLGEHLAVRLQNAEAARAAYQRAANLYEGDGETGTVTELLARMVALAPGDRATVLRLLDHRAAAQDWDDAATLVGLLVGGARDAHDGAKLLLSIEPFANSSAVSTRFIAEADALLAERLSSDTRRALRAARARVLGLSPTRFGDAALAYRQILAEGDGSDGELQRAFDALLEARGRGAESDRRWLFRYRVDTAAADAKVPLLLAWAHAEESSLGDPSAAMNLYAEVLRTDPEHDAALAARARLVLAEGDVEGALSLLERRRAHARAVRELPLTWSWRPS